MASIPPGTLKRCDLCRVEIRGMVGGIDQVVFSQGAPGSRAKLWARVCQFVKEPQRCINQEASLRGEVAAEDFYGEPPSLGPFGAPSGGDPQDAPPAG
jgi:hypothetical protein